MATSGSVDFTVTRDSIITEALYQLGVVAEGDSPSTDQLTSTARTLNMLVKFWQAEGLNLFAVERLYLFPQKDVSEYTLGSDAKISSSYTQTAIATAGVATDTSIEVDSITGISDADVIGVELDAGTIHWTTVNGVPAGTTVNITDALPSAVAVDRVVFAYTTVANRPMKLLEAVTRSKSGTDTTIELINRGDYVDHSTKGSDGQVTELYYNPLTSTGQLFVWPQTNDETDVIVMWVQRTLEDFDAASDEADFPQEWYLPLAFGLAQMIGHKYGVPRQMLDILTLKAEEYKDIAQGFDREESIRFTAERRN